MISESRPTSLTSSSRRTRSFRLRLSGDPRLRATALRAHSAGMPMESERGDKQVDIGSTGDGEGGHIQDYVLSGGEIVEVDDAMVDMDEGDPTMVEEGV